VALNEGEQDFVVMDGILPKRMQLSVDMTTLVCFAFMRSADELIGRGTPDLDHLLTFESKSLQPRCS